jgi:aerotaxis receptor
VIAVSANAREVTFSADELIVSKTDLRGNLTYANRHFMRVSNFAESELLGQPHNIIRHPEMPRGVYHAMWKTLKSKQEFFGFVKNLTSDGNFYWVFANVTPDFNKGNVEGFFSVRRQAPRAALAVIEPVYRQMLELENRSRKDSAPTDSWQWLQEHIQSDTGLSYEEFVIGLYEEHC